MIEMTADRLVLVDGGTARPFDGSIEDYIAFVLAKEPKGEGSAKGGVNRKDARREAAEAREKGNAMRKAAKAAEAELTKLQEKLSAIDRAMFDPATAAPDLAKLTMTELMKQRGAVVKGIEAAETAWMEAQEALEALAA
jgi:ATP-binding cassette subfamily F protein 3